MTNKKNLVMLLGIAFVVAVIATGLFYGLVVTKLNQAAQSSQDVVQVAATDLEPGHVLTASDLRTAPRSEVDALVAGFESAAELSGLVVLVRLAAGEALERGMVASKDSARGAALGVRPGLRAVSIHVADSAGIIQILQPGHRVDAQIVAREKGATLRTVLQNLEVLRAEKEPEASEGRPVLPVVTLLATPEEADALGIGDAAARIRLLLRHPLDEELTQRPSVALVGVLRNPPKQESRGDRVSLKGSNGSEAPKDGKSVETAARRPAGDSAER